MRASERELLRRWLFDAVLPIWWERGANHSAAGGFHDRLFPDGRAEQRPLRLRVQARQIFVYAEAGRWGWSGPWQDAVEHGMRTMIGSYRRDDGLYRAAMHYSGDVASDTADLYDQAFVLLALAAAWHAQGRPSALLAEAQQLVIRLRQTLAHPIAGFEESRPRTLPLRSNPHMHMLEAMLAWMELGEEEIFVDMARELVAIATDRLIDRSTGSVGEYFDGDWLPAAGDSGALREPGHQFEWAFLLSRAGDLLGLDLASFVKRLYAFATAHGVVDGRVIAAVDVDGRIVDRGSRLWQQTERLRAVLALGAVAGDCAPDHVDESIAGFRRFLNIEAPGFWHDRLDGQGAPIVEASPASSLYHVMTGLHYFVGKN